MLTLFGPSAVKKPKKKKSFSRYTQYDYILGGRKLKVQGYERQALDYLVAKGFDPADIRTEFEFGDMLRIRYKYKGKTRQYLPDIYIVSERIIVEVKSTHTLGLFHNKKRGWGMTCAKAIACHKRGYRFVLLLLDQHGNRLRMPKNWAYMKKEECRRAVEELNPTEARSGLFMQL